MQKFLQSFGSPFGSCSFATSLRIAEIQIHQTPIAPYAMRRMHHRIAHIQLGQIFDQGLHIADLLLLFASARDSACGEELGFSDEIYGLFIPTETRRQSRCGNTQFFGTGLKFL